MFDGWGLGMLKGLWRVAVVQVKDCFLLPGPKDTRW